MPESQVQVKLNPDSMPSGSDLTVVNAARKSFSSRSEWGVVKVTGRKILKEKDKRLIEFLARGMTAKDFEGFLAEFDWPRQGYDDVVRKLWEWRNTPEHKTPFNHCFVSFVVKAPIFVARQLVKHKFLPWSEHSGRYIENLEFYRPDTWREAPENKKQGSGGPAKAQYHPNTYIQEVEEFAVERFKKMVGEGQNICMEQARMIMPLSTMTEWTWSGSLGAFADMCRLRLHPDAQYETRLVAQQVYEYLKEYYPVSAKALVEGPDV